MLRDPICMLYGPVWFVMPNFQIAILISLNVVVLYWHNSIASDGVPLVSDTHRGDAVYIINIISVPTWAGTWELQP